MPTAGQFESTKGSLRELVRQHFDPVFLRAAFKRKSLAWNRWVAEEICHVADVQLDKYGNDRELSFTLNFGAFVPHIHEICWGNRLSGFIKESDCIARIRVGQLAYISDLKAAKDTWWTLNERASVREIGEEVASLIMALGIPFLDSMRSLADIQKFLEQTYEQINYPASVIYLAAIDAELGGKERARALLAHFERPQLHAWRARAEQAKSRLGL